MSRRYRLVYFRPFLPTAERILIGALIEKPERSAFVARPKLPCESCVGGPASASLMRLGIEAMTARPPFGLSVPNALGPAFWADVARTAPDSGATVEEFVREHLLQRRRSP